MDEVEVLLWLGLGLEVVRPVREVEEGRGEEVHPLAELDDSEELDQLEREELERLEPDHPELDELLR